MPLYPSLVLEVRSDPQVPTFRNSTYLDPQMGLIKDLGVRQQLLANGVQMIICILFLKNETELKLHSSSIDPIM
jgi:hypothetical protein